LHEKTKKPCSIPNRDKALYKILKLVGLERKAGRLNRFHAAYSKKLLKLGGIDIRRANAVSYRKIGGTTFAEEQPLQTLDVSSPKTFST
jgi:hypothetical protein